MAQFVKLSASGLNPLREVDERLVSYNVEMTEVTGGTFWKAYTDAQIDGTEQVPPPDFSKGMGAMHQWYDPIDTKNPRLIKLAKDLGAAWIRVSGTWANKTYYDFDNKYEGKVPEGFQNVLTKQQWLNLLDFVKAVDGKLLVSIANCPGIHAANEPMPFEQAELLFRTSKEYGVPISAAEFTNEPNMFQVTGFPAGYKVEHYIRDQELFHSWVRENYPDTILVGPCTVDTMKMGDMSTAGVGAAFGTTCSTDDLLNGAVIMPQVFSYHYYNGISERLAAVMPKAHWPAEMATSDINARTVAAYLRSAGRMSAKQISLSGLNGGYFANRLFLPVL